MPLLMKEPEQGPLPDEAEIEIGAGLAGAVVARRGQLLTITDVEGRQPAALFGVTLANPREFLSPHHTRVFSNSFMLRLGMRLVTNRPASDPGARKGYREQQRSPVSRRGQRLSRAARTTGTGGRGGECTSGVRRYRYRAAEMETSCRQLSPKSQTWRNRSTPRSSYRGPKCQDATYAARAGLWKMQQS